MIAAIFMALLTALGAAAAHAQGPGQDQPTPPVIIGTAASSGVYYQIGAALCRFVAIRADGNGRPCRSEVSGGSRANVLGLVAGDVQLAIVQANVLYSAAHGLGAFADSGPQTSLRLVMRLYDEQVTVVARPGAGIASLDDLRGKRVDLGPAGSGTRVDAISVLRAAGIAPTDLAEDLALSPDEHNQALCAGRIDAYFYIVGHPNRNTRAAIERCNATLVPISAAVRERFLWVQTGWADAPIPGVYPRHPGSVATLSIPAVLIATEDTPADIVALLVRGVQDNLHDFRRLHPVLAGFSDLRAFNGPWAPLHPGTLDRRLAGAQP
jgi:TRAP transporter TAXI family solute receptor